MGIAIRVERTEDRAAIRAVHEAAFDRSDEASLVDALRSRGGVLLSLLAVEDGRVVGHVLYSPVSVGSDARRIEGAGLGPVAVLPQCQRRGIGAMLIDEGNRRIERINCPFVVVLGDPAYYTRFGFEPARQHGMTCVWDVPHDAFMVSVLQPVLMERICGVATYRPEFSDVA